MFNLSKHAQSGVGELDGAVRGLGSGIDEATELVHPNESSELNIEDVTQGLPEDAEATVRDSAQAKSWDRVMFEIGQMPPEVKSALQRTPDFQQWQDKIKTVSPSLGPKMDQLKLEGADLPLIGTQDIETLETSVLSRARALAKAIDRQKNMQILQKQPPIAFNLNKYKIAQSLPTDSPINPQSQLEPASNNFPVVNQGDFISKFLQPLLMFNNQPGTQEYETARQAESELMNAVSPGMEQEADSVIKTIMESDPNTQQQDAQNSLLRFYDVLLAPAFKADQQNSEAIMSQSNNQIPGIISYSLTDSILSNKTNSSGIVKTAADQFGQQYLLYGPTEKRICPKLRGKNLSVGDVVSEYTCRHHCLDGIVIDDNKTICGEALWRANSMDKFSREYVDEDGNTVGGYLNKRFEINRNVPEENKMRLKPGETRKPRPAAWGNMESRLQDMRAKEGQKRDYRPETNTGDAFEWCHDVDQNNVETSQLERNRRENSSGHQLVQYTKQEQSENKPKLSFNFKTHKTAQQIAKPIPRDQHQTAVNPTVVDIVPPETKNPRIDPAKPMSQSDFETEKYDFANGIAKAKSMSTEELMHAIRDLTQVINIQEKSSREGHSTPKLGYYHDERSTYSDELHKRRQGKSQTPTPSVHQRADEGAADQNSWQSMQEGRTDDDINRRLSGKFNLKNFKTAKTCWEGDCWDVNPWAVCNKSTGGKNEAGKDKFERCVQKVKSKGTEESKKKR